MFYLDLQKGNEEVTVEFYECDHSLGHKWADALRNHIDTKLPVSQPNRIYNLNDQWTEPNIVNAICHCIEVINTYKPVIDYQITGDSITQEDSNKLHHYFEILRGENESPNEFYINAPSLIKKYIEEYNVLIHRWEDLGLPGRIVVHFRDRPVFDLADEDYQHWTLDYQPGDIKLNYCHKGKTIFDVFKDQDDIVGEDNIRPQFKYSPDFNLGFIKGPGEIKQFNDWWIDNQEKLGYSFRDPKAAIGHAVVGKCVDDPEKVKQYIYGSTRILRVRHNGKSGRS